MKVLDKEGMLLAAIFGIVLYFFGGPAYLALMLVFFILAVIVTRYGYDVKRDLGLYEHERGWENVLSNGFLPAILAILSPFTGPGPFIASMAAVTADKFASEVGVLEQNPPISLLDLKPAKPGTSGAVSSIGTIASLGGAALIGVGAIYLFHIGPNAALIVAIAGLAGSIIDSIFGVLEERGIGTKGTTNFICSLAGAIIGYYFIKI